MVGVPVPVLDHLGATSDEGPRDLPPLAFERREVARRAADCAGIGLGDQKRRLLGCVHPVRRKEQAPRTRCGPTLWRSIGAGYGEGVLHGVVRVPGGHIEGAGEAGVVHGRPFVGDARRDELVVAGVLPHDIGLPGDEFGGQLGLERAPGEIVLRLPVAVWFPQISPGAELVGPVPAPTPR